ncbi:MAG: DNA repair protein RadC [Marinifilaceae bacterium]|jgi:DNA repair protein RadC|nr:DNA repair protein RadC [Marinifilaceae bacterium]
MDTRISIKNWSEDDKPREKLMTKGAKNLSNAELLTIIIANGSKELSALDLSKSILNYCSNDLDRLHRMRVEDLTSIKGIGPAKAVSILAAIELGLRISINKPTNKLKVNSSEIAFDVLGPEMYNLNHEELWALLLNRANMIIDKVKLTQGGMSQTIFDLRAIVRKSIVKDASSVILAHNHPSGNLQASEDDKKVTFKLKKALDYFDIKLLDHIIVHNNTYYSFADDGII